MDAEWSRIVEAARQEGEVIVWGQAGEERRQFWKDAFERAYPGIRVNLFQASSSSERDSRFLMEYEAGVARVDVLVAGSASANARVKPIGALQSVRPLLRPEVLDPKNWRDGKLIWVDSEQEYFLLSDTIAAPAVAVHRSIAEGEIQSWDDLLNPKYRGKIVMLDPRGSGRGFAAATFLYYYPGLGPEFTKEFYRNGIVFSSDERQNAEWVDSGRMLIYVYPNEREIESLRSVGGTLRVIPVLKVKGMPAGSVLGSDGILFIPNINPLPHPNAARVYVNWFYSREGQQAMADIMRIPSNRVDVDVKNVPSYTVPQPGVDYMILNHYSDTEVVRELRDDVSRWHIPPQ
ncbi:MAG TPA: extracellular solute-binding protein [Chloroflexota bacterium]|nr:extracellular solute-binding protein [Chloroflexota bacterium]